MNHIKATIKIAQSDVAAMMRQLEAAGVQNVSVHIVPYPVFVQESRMNYDCVFPDLWEDQQDVAYLEFSFDDTEAGRALCYRTEFDLKQIPLNLRYEQV